MLLSLHIHKAITSRWISTSRFPNLLDPKVQLGHLAGDFATPVDRHKWNQRIETRGETRRPENPVSGK